jgi:hypothetical protein
VGTPWWVDIFEASIWEEDVVRWEERSIEVLKGRGDV